MVSKHKGDFSCLRRVLESVVEYGHGLLPVTYWLHTHLRADICTCWTGGGKSSHISIPQPVVWNSPQLPASNNSAVWVLLIAFMRYGFEVLPVTSPQYADQRLQWQWEAVHPRCTRPLPIWQKHRLEKTLGGHLVQIPWASRASCLGPGTNNFWVCPKREIPQHLWETCASTLCSVCEHKWMVHLGCCKLVLPLGAGASFCYI